LLNLAAHHLTLSKNEQSGLHTWKGRQKDTPYLYLFG